MFQGRFKSSAVQREGYWVSCGRYIERNPLEAGVAAVPWDYRWSSAAFYAEGKVDALVDENPSFTELAAEAGRRQALWREFVLGEDEREEAVRGAIWAVGDEGFAEGLAEQRGRTTRPRRGRPSDTFSFALFEGGQFVP